MKPPILSLIAALSGLTAASAASLPPIGLWQGTYTCAQGKTALALEITASGPQTVRAIFYFHALTTNQTVPQGCFSMHGSFDPATRHLTLTPDRWLARPSFYVWTALSGTVTRGGTAITGTIGGPACTSFSLAPHPTPPVPPAPAACRLEHDGPTV